MENKDKLIENHPKIGPKIEMIQDKSENQS